MLILLTLLAASLMGYIDAVLTQINKLQLCKPLIRAIEQMPIKDKFPIAQLVTYRLPENFFISLPVNYSAS